MSNVALPSAATGLMACAVEMYCTNRLNVAVVGGWHFVGGGQLLRCRVTLTNVGMSKVVLSQDGTEVRVSPLASNQPTVVSLSTWEDNPKIFEIFSEPELVESHEAVSDEFLINLQTGVSFPVKLEARIVCAGPPSVTVRDRFIVLP
jgi:hypothetical protein